MKSADAQETNGTHSASVAEVHNLRSVESATATTWIDLLDPDEETLRRAWPQGLHPSALEKLLAPARYRDDPRPRLESQGSYVFGVFLVPEVMAEENEVCYQELYLVLTHSVLLTVRKTPPDGRPFDPTLVKTTCQRERSSAGMHAFHLLDEVAERYLTLVDDLNAEIDELEENIETLPGPQVRARVSGLRHDLLYIRRSLTPTRDAVRGVIDDRIDTDGEELFPHDVEVHFSDVYDKLLRASEGLELCRDLVAGVRDYHQAHVANEQNDVMKRLTAVASILLLPGLIVGIYGQNLRGSPEQHWAFGYWWSLGLILVMTLAQLAVFRKKRWI